MTQDDAEIVSLQVLGWLAADPERFGGFLAAGGLAAGDVNARAAEPVFLAAVLDFLLESDARIADFAGAAGLDPAIPGAARRALPGGDAPEWT
jgi:hypothetical protein